jgi:hypothetical protein
MMDVGLIGHVHKKLAENHVKMLTSIRKECFFKILRERYDGKTYGPM